MPDIKIRPYASSDFEAIAGIHDASRRAELSMASLEDAFLPFSIAAEREDFFDYPHIDVALVNGCAAGFCAYTEDELAWLYVSPEMMRRGIGKRLVENALNTESGIKSIEVLCGNEPARKLYESFGFCVQETARGAMPGNESFQVEAYCMRRI